MSGINCIRTHSSTCRNPGGPRNELAVPELEPHESMPRGEDRSCSRDSPCDAWNSRAETRFRARASQTFRFAGGGQMTSETKFPLTVQ